MPYPSWDVTSTRSSGRVEVSIGCGRTTETQNDGGVLVTLADGADWVVVPGAVWELETAKTGSALFTVTSPTAIGPDILRAPKAVVGQFPPG